MLKKIFTIFAALTLSAGLMAETVPYIDEAGEFQTADATEITDASEPVTWGTAGTTTWYVVKGEDVQLSQGAVCAGDVRLILADGAKLTATGEWYQPGIQVSGEGNSLTIYGQTNQSGQLIANSGYAGAGIGGGNSQDGSNITINGGIIEATGNGGTGIGGGSGSYGYNITIYGGVVTAIGGDAAAGIGGASGSDGYNITIYGGVVTAKGGFSGAGIGGGYDGSGSNITINGGEVTATGGEEGAGIGGGWGDFGSNISINGGVVTATGGNNGASIGSGHEGPASSNIYVATNLVVKAGSAANPTTVITNTGADLASNLAGKQYATVEPKPVPHKSDHFVDATSGLRFEVTAVGEANTVKVTDNNYTGTSYIVPDTVKYLDVDFAVTEIGYRAFKSCSALQSIDLPNVTKILGEAFFDCTSLSTITLPASLTTIGIGTFSGCEGLTSVTFLGNACTIGEDVFAGVGKDAPALLTLPNSWTGTKPDEDGNWYGGKFVMSSTPTVLPTLFGDGVKGNKFMHNGQMIIRKGDKLYNAVGAEF